MNHLTDEQFLAKLDDALDPSARAACDAHLGSCEACRLRLAEWGALEASLGPALVHDPGEAYFATFADRVAARIAGAAPEGDPAGVPAADRRAGKRRMPWDAWRFPGGGSLAAGLAALVVTAGVAWLRFQAADDAGSALRAAAPDRNAPAPAVPGGARAGKEHHPNGAEPAAVPLPAAQEPAVQARDQAAATMPQAGIARSTPEQDAPRLEARAPEVPAADMAGGPADAGAAAESPSASRKDAATPAPRPADRSLWQTARHLWVTPPPPVRVPAPSTSAQAPAVESKSLAGGSGPAAPGGTADAVTRTSPALNRSLEQDSPGTGGGPLSVPCGKVTDTRGTPVRGALIAVLGSRARTSRSGADGSFCLPDPVAGDTLVLMHVGFEPVRMVLTAETPLDFRLEPVGTLGPRDGWLLGSGRAAGSASPPSVPRVVPPPDVYAGRSAVVRAAVARARERAAIARRDRTAAAWEDVAERWAAIGAGLTGGPALDARFQSLAAWREARGIEPGEFRTTRLRAAMAEFLKAAPEAMPERATVLRWQSELDSPQERQER